jgi:hypothetical protein
VALVGKEYILSTMTVIDPRVQTLLHQDPSRVLVARTMFDAYSLSPDDRDKAVARYILGTVKDSSRAFVSGGIEVAAKGTARTYMRQENATEESTTGKHTLFDELRECLAKAAEPLSLINPLII